jgi:hypothetical protein
VVFFDLSSFLGKHLKYNNRIKGNITAISLLKSANIKHSIEERYSKILYLFISICLYKIYKTVPPIKNKAVSRSALAAT